jgi:hypothetical protein
MQSQPGRNIPCVNNSVHNNINVYNVRNTNGNGTGIKISPILPTAHSVSASLVSLDSYANDMDLLVVAASYHNGHDYNGGVGEQCVGVGVDNGVDVATGHINASTASTDSAGTNYYNKPMDDLDIMLQHQDFAQLLTLAVKVKQARLQAYATGTNGTGGTGQGGAAKTRQASTALEPSEVIAAVSRLQDQLLAAGPNNDDITSRRVIPRGVYPITDSIMDDSLETLQNELDRCYRCLEQQGEYGKAATNAMATTEPTSAAIVTNKKTKAQKKGGRGKKEAIAVKYSKWQTDILMNWMIENKDKPFPDQDEIKNLMRMTGLSHSQVVNWTTNVRKRNRKATCQGGKKPHHFIDFLFLAQDRENREKKQKEQEQKQQKQKQVRAVKVESNNDALTPYTAPSYQQQRYRQPEQRRKQKEQQPQERQRQYQHQEAYPSPKQIQSQQRQHQEAYPSPKQIQSQQHQHQHQEAYPSPRQLQSSSIHQAQQRQHQEAYPSPKQLQSSNLYQIPSRTDMEYHYHHRSSGHPGSLSFPRNKPSESLLTYGNDWEHAPSLQKVHSIGGSGSALEPLLIDDMSEVVLLDDFSSFWFEDKPNPNPGDNATSFKSNSDNDSMDVLEYHQHRHNYTTAPDVHVQPLLPSVTDDQDAAAMTDYPRSNKPMLVMTEDHVDLDELDDMKLEDIHDWAADLGFVAEI